jgi:O-methyltransferase
VAAHFDMQNQIDEIEERRKFLRKAFMAIWVNMIPGDYAEFGCCGATTFRLAHQASRGNLVRPHLWAFDSFKGLPKSESAEEHPRWVSGAMTMDRNEFISSLDFHGVQREDYTIVEGYYSETLRAPGADEYCKDIAIAYVDCDMYESTREVLHFLKGRLKHGMIIAFDDYYCWWSKGVAGERIAFLEFESETRSEYNFLPLYNFGWHGQSFVVEARQFLKHLDTDISESKDRSRHGFSFFRRT